MDNPRQTAIGVAAVAAMPAALGFGAASAAWRNPLMSPLRTRTDSLLVAAARRGELVEARVVAIVADELERRIALALEDPRLEALVQRAFASQLAAAMGESLRSSEELRLTVQAVAESPEVRAALQAQSTGLAREVQDEVRTRTAGVDDAIERTARRFLRRQRKGSPTVVLP